MAKYKGMQPKPLHNRPFDTNFNTQFHNDVNDIIYKSVWIERTYSD